jgi:hypothetical protein
VGAIDRFFEDTGWKARRGRPVAGALVDTAHDHVYTDWQALDRFAEEMALALEPRLGAVAPRAA